MLTLRLASQAGRRFLALGLASLAFGLPATSVAGPVTLRYACASGGDELKSLNRIVAQFEREHPDIRIKVEPIVENYENKLLSMVAANVAPDIANVSPKWYTMFSSRGALMPLGRFPDLQENLDGRYPNIVDAFRRDGQVYAIPRDIACSAYIYYNKDLFRQAGIPFPDGSWTWDTKVRPELREKDFFWVVKTLTKRRQGTKRPVQYGLTTAWPQLWMDTLLESSNVRMWDSDEKPAKLYLDDPKVVEIFRWASDTINKHHWMPSNNEVFLGGGGTMQDEFRKGKIAMLQSGAWEVKDMRLKMRGDWDIAPFPTYARGESPYLPGEGAGTAIFRTTRYPEQAWTFIKWFNGPKGLIPMAQEGESQPSIRSLATTPGIWLPAADAEGAQRLPANLAITDAVSRRVRYRQFPEYFRGGVANDIQGMYYGVLAGEND
ncbi:MAG TPA: sugar ABC transporter substrate-binding protein, partial [Fimbriimonas sp.]